MHRDDSVELLRIEFILQRGAQSVLGRGGGTKAYDAERGAAACPRLVVMRATARIMF